MDRRYLSITPLVVFLFVFTLKIAAAGKPDCHYTVVISLDGCRWDYPQWYNTPFFDYMEKKGVAGVIVPSFPSKTFPNHYTLATGLYPDHHGIVANRFYDRKNHCIFDLGDSITKFDPRYYGGEPIWLTAQRQGLHTAEIYWPGSDVPVGGKYPDSYYKYDAKPQLTLKQRAKRIIEQLRMPESKRPRLIMAYFEQPDEHGHNYGPQDKRTGLVVEEMDSLVKTIWDDIQQLPIAADVNFIVTSDHGMTSISNERTIPVMRYLKKEWIESVEGDLPGLIYARKGYVDSVVLALHDIPHLKVWKREDIPAYLHFGSNPMIGDVVALPELGWLFTDKTVSSFGSHGFDPSYCDMQAMFRAVGPDFKQGYSKQQQFRNVDLYSLLSRLLGIIPAKNDGDINEVKDLLK